MLPVGPVDGSPKSMRVEKVRFHKDGTIEPVEAEERKQSGGERTCSCPCSCSQCPAVTTTTKSSSSASNKKKKARQKKKKAEMKEQKKEKQEEKGKEAKPAPTAVRKMENLLFAGMKSFSFTKDGSQNVKFAISCFDEAIATAPYHPNTAKAYCERSNCYFELKEMDKSLADAENGIGLCIAAGTGALKPTLAKLHYYRARALYQVQRGLHWLEEAKDSIVMALDMDKSTAGISRLYTEYQELAKLLFAEELSAGGAMMDDSEMPGLMSPPDDDDDDDDDWEPSKEYPTKDPAPKKEEAEEEEEKETDKEQKQPLLKKPKEQDEKEEQLYGQLAKLIKGIPSIANKFKEEEENEKYAVAYQAFSKTTGDAVAIKEEETVKDNGITKKQQKWHHSRRQEERERRKAAKEAQCARKEEDELREDPMIRAMRLLRLKEADEVQRRFEESVGAHYVGRCGRAACARYSKRIADDKPYVRVECSRQCIIFYHHPGCWRPVTRFYSEKDLQAGAVCLTPDCEGMLSFIEVLGDKQVHILVKRTQPLQHHPPTPNQEAKEEAKDDDEDGKEETKEEKKEEKAGVVVVNATAAAAVKPKLVKWEDKSILPVRLGGKHRKKELLKQERQRQRLERRQQKPQKTTQTTQTTQPTQTQMPVMLVADNEKKRPENAVLVPLLPTKIPSRAEFASSSPRKKPSTKPKTIFTLGDFFQAMDAGEETPEKIRKAEDQSKPKEERELIPKQEEESQTKAEERGEKEKLKEKEKEDEVVPGEVLHLLQCSLSSLGGQFSLVSTNNAMVGSAAVGRDRFLHF